MKKNSAFQNLLILTNKEAQAILHFHKTQRAFQNTREMKKTQAPSVSYISGVFYHSLLHGLGFFIRFIIREVM